MKLRAGVLTLAMLALMTSSAVAGNLYDNGPVNDNQAGWTINFGFTVTDTIQVNGTVQGLDFWTLLIPGDTVTSVEVSIGSSPFGQNLFDGVMSVTQSDCFSDPFGFNLCHESGSLSGPTLNGNYWLTLQNASVPSGDPVYWNENSGNGCMSPGCPSMAQENTLGTIPSEAFTVLGTAGTTTTSTSTGTTPEPGSIVLLGSGGLGIVGVLRRKLG
ncbi:MAG: PEP-CTERM sorting domain-containing protein [Candidatus Korobacteraceae bacterium]